MGLLRRDKALRSFCSISLRSLSRKGRPSKHAIPEPRTEPQPLGAEHTDDCLENRITAMWRRAPNEKPRVVFQQTPGERMPVAEQHTPWNRASLQKFRPVKWHMDALF